MKKPVRVAIIGAGYWGPNLVRNFHALDGVEVAYICDLDRKKLNALHALYPSVTATTKTTDIFSDASVDAVVIATPVPTHHPLGKQALESGKHTLIEKPIADTPDKAKQLVNLAATRSRILMVDHTFVYASPVMKMREMVDKKKLGKLCYFDSVRVNLGLFQPNTNVLWDLATHDLSIMDYLIDKKPTHISAIGASHIQKNLENIVYVTIKFPGDLIAHIHVNWLAPVKLRMTLLAGLKKMIVYNDMEPMEKVKVYDRGIDYHPEADGLNLARFQYRVGDMFSPRLDDVEALHNMCSHFIECIRTGTSPKTDGHAGLRIVSMLDAAHQSMKSNGKYITLQLT